MTPEEQIQFTIEVLTKTVNESQDKLAYASASRKQMMLAIDSKTPNQRLDWIKESSRKVVVLLSNISKEYNILHDFDRCTLSDLNDILDIAKTLLTPKK